MIWAKAISLFLTHWKWCAIGGLVLLFVVTSARLHYAKSDLTAARAALVDPDTRKPWKAEAQAAVRDLGICHANTATLEASLSRQSAAVDALKAESDARVAQSQKAASSARAVAESLRQTAGDILGRKAGVDKCAAAAELITEVAQR